MPTYQYACTACGHRFEAVQSFSDSSLTDCPECAGRLRKVFSSVGIVFKGSGFYRTDSRAGAKDGGEKAADSTGADSGTTKDSGTKDGGSSTKEPVAKKADAGSASGSSGSTASGKSTTKAGTAS